MPMTNAERQRRWRERVQQKLALRDDPRAALWKQVKPLIEALEAEGKKNQVLASPRAVAESTTKLRLLLDPGYAAVESGETKAVEPAQSESPDPESDFPGNEQRQIYPIASRGGATVKDVRRTKLAKDLGFPADQVERLLRAYPGLRQTAIRAELAKLVVPSTSSIPHEATFCGKTVWPRRDDVTEDDVRAGWNFVHLWTRRLETGLPAEKPRQVAETLRHLINDLREAATLRGLATVMSECVTAYDQAGGDRANSKTPGRKIRHG